MSKSKAKQYRREDHENWDEYSEHNYRSKEDKMRNKRKERRIDHAIRTKNLDELLDVEDEWEFD